MNSKHILTFLIISASAISCQDGALDIVDGNGPKAITFTAAVPETKASEVTYDKLIQDSFVMNAFHHQNTGSIRYIEDSILSYKDGAWISSKMAFWPKSGSMAFYSLYPKDLQVSFFSERNVPYFKFTVNRQEDILYATTVKDCEEANSKQEGAGDVEINFRHAMSQVLFKLKNTNPDWKIDVLNVKISSVKSSGTFHFPDENDGIGYWTDIVQDHFDIPAEFAEVKLDGVDTADITSSGKGAVFMLPQTNAGWDPEHDPQNRNGGSYILINCRINKVKGNGTEQVWPSEPGACREVAVPLAIDWKIGMRYTYTLSFGRGAGYIPPTEVDGGKRVLSDDPMMTKCSVIESVIE